MKRYFTNQIVKDGRVSLLLYGNVGDGERVDSAGVVAELMELAAQYDKIDVHINSKGGDVFGGMAIYNALRNSAADIAIYVDGLAASIAGVIALCGKPLYMNRYARLMLHRVSGYAYGTADDMRRTAEQAESLENDLADMIAGRCGMKAEDVKAAYFDGGEHWFTAQEAMDTGMISGIVDSGGVQEPAANATTEEIYDYTNRLLEPQKDENMALLEEIKKKSSFSNLATEEQVLRKIDSLENQAAKVPDLENKVNELQEELGKNRKAAREAFLNQAVSEGRIAKDVVPHFLNLMEKDEKAVRDAIGAMPKKGTARVEDYLGGGTASGAAKLADMSWDEIDKAERLAELKNRYPDLYQKKFNEKFGK